MNLILPFTCIVLITTALSSIAAENTAQPVASSTSYSVTLYEGAQATTLPESVPLVHAKTIELLETSNFNSRGPILTWDMTEFHQDYRRAVASKYLLVTYKEPHKVKTIGGEISVREIIVGLGRAALFTIDDEGRIVAHSKYAGALWVQLLEQMKK